ncbi:disks large-associated protein 2-like isoform X4 [Carassius auratus]|uniref:Disks large-associated protein 2-like isoform X4 n=1 Tax=Carassius auratus TaxID=7957 RepID=A0A6P6RPB4_CARAU|nr:disks large-associated protein 2-like isoform X4 [Carassius auratus]
MSALKKVLPWILQTHCCLFLDKSPDQQCSPWSPSRDFNEDSSLAPPRNMKGLSGGRAPHQIPTLPPCGLAECEHLHDLHGMHVSDLRHSYLLSPTETCAMDYHHRLSPRSSIHSDCMIMSPVALTSTAPADHISSSTFPRMHYSSQYYDTAAREDCAAITTSATSAAIAAATSASHHVSSKSNRIPANLLDQFEKQLPLHRDGFHTLQYQRTSPASGGEQRSESPGRIRHLVHSVQKLFTKSHSLEGSSKMNGTKGDSGGGGSHHHHHGNHHSSKHGSKRSKSKERRHRSGTGGWWSSDDNLDSDSTYRTASALSRHHYEHVGHSFPESMHTHFGDHSLKTSKSNNDVKCSACEGLSMAPEGKFMKRSSWSTLTVSQAKEAYRKSSLNLEKPMMHQDLKPSFRASHYLQVPQDEWGGYPGIEKDEEIPCRRMRSSSYVKAMGDDDSGESDTSPKTSPQKTVRSDALVLKSAMQRPHIDTQSSGYHLQTTRDMRPHPSVSLDPATTFNPPQFRSRNQSYMRAVSTFSQASCVSQGKNQSEKEKGRGKIKDCYSCFCLSGIQFRLPTACSVDRTETPNPAVVTYTPGYKKTPPPVPPRSTTKPVISVTAQSSTESTQDAYHEGRPSRGGLWATDSLGRVIYTSTDSLDSAKAVTLAMETAPKRLTSAGSYSSVQTCDKAILVSKAEEYLKTPRSSIGIQVEAATDSETDSKGLPQYHSVGIQVEDEKRIGRFKRSNSVTTAVQADLELEGFPSTEDKSLQFGGFQRHSEPSTPTQYNAVRTVRTQGLFSYREDYRPSSGPPSPQPEPWLVEPAHEAAESGRVSPLHRDGSWFMQLLHSETKRLEGWCKDMEREAEEHDLSEEILGKIRSAVGSAHLLMSQKFQQFYWLCQQNLDPSAMPRPTAQDLAGFWDLLQLSIDDVTAKFDELQQIKRNEWRIVESPEKKERKWPPPVTKRPPKGRGAVMRDRSLDLQDRQRQEARRRLLAAKRAASFRQSSVTERADSIEIYIPEAQTRL